MQHSKGITVGTYTVKTKKKVNSLKQRRKLILYLSVQLVRNAKIGLFVAIGKNLPNVLYVKIVVIKATVIFTIFHLVVKLF